MRNTSESEQNIELTAPLSLQPVYDRDLELAAFHLLVDRRENKHVEHLPAIGSAIVRHFAGIPQSGRISDLPCLFEVDESMLASTELKRLSSNYFILQIPSRLLEQQQTVAAARKLAELGFRLACAGTPKQLADIIPRLERVQIARVETAGLGATLSDAIDPLKQLDVQLLADHLSSADDYQRCLDLGFDYFHGDFLPKPSSSAKEAGSNRLLLLRILAELARPETSIDKLEELILRDANLTYKFMAVVNSARYGIEREINTLFQALGMLGTKQIRAWVAIFLLESGKEQRADLVRQSLVRARMCELIAEIAEKEKSISYFIVGLLSQLDVLTGVAMETLMADTPLNADIKQALLTGEGEKGEVLREAIHYEHGEFDRLSLLPDGSFYVSAYQHSFAWARQLLADLGD